MDLQPPHLSLGFLLRKMDFRETLSKIMNVKYLTWYWAHGKYFHSIIIAIIILNWVLKKQSEFEKPNSGRKAFQPEGTASALSSL